MMKAHHYPDWTKKELAFIKDNYKKMKYKEIATALGRTSVAIGIAVNTKLRLKKHLKYTNDEIEQIKLYWTSLSDDELSSQLGRPIGSILKAGERHGLHRKDRYKARPLVQKQPKKDVVIPDYVSECKLPQLKHIASNMIKPVEQVAKETSLEPWKVKGLQQLIGQGYFPNLYSI